MQKKENKTSKNNELYEAIDIVGIIVLFAMVVAIYIFKDEFSEVINILKALHLIRYWM